MRNLDRRTFIRGMTVCISGCVSELRVSNAAESRSKTAINFFERNLIIDGILSPLPKGGSWLLNKGEVKRLSGVDIAVMSTKVSRLPSYRDFFLRHGDAYHLVQTVKDIAHAKRHGKCGIILYVQKDFSLNNDLDRVLEWKKLGLRVLQFTYSDRNDLGGGSRFDKEPLTKLGKSLLESCNSNGILVDVSHCGRQTTLDITHGSAKPVTANHANSEELCAHRRNKSLEEIQAIAATGGVIGVTSIGRFLKPPKKQTATINDFVNHIDYLVENVGIDHVGVGSDCFLDGKQVYPKLDDTDRFLNSYERWYHVADHLVERGYKNSDLKKIFGGNFLRVFRSSFDNKRFDPNRK